MIFGLTLNSSILGQPPDLGRVGNRCGLRLWTVGITIGPLIETLVILHVQGHAALVTFEAALVPNFVETSEALDRVDGFITTGAFTGAHDGGLAGGVFSKQSIMFSGAR